LSSSPPRQGQLIQAELRDQLFELLVFSFESLSRLASGMPTPPYWWRHLIKDVLADAFLTAQFADTCRACFCFAQQMHDLLCCPSLFHDFRSTLNLKLDYFPEGTSPTGYSEFSF